jgi:Fe2+ or Zn2+ uptake regulation protein
MNTTQYNYATVVQALDDLKQRGYVDEFAYKDDYLFCDSRGIQFNPLELKITEVYRFEGETDPEDSSVVYAIESATGLKGVIIDAYGMYADTQKSAFINSLKMAN